MAFNGITVSAVAEEIRRRAVHGRVVKIQQPLPAELQITIKKEKDTVKILLSADAGLPRVYITEKQKPSPLTAPAFLMLLRKHIGSAKLISVEQPDFERVLVFTFEHLDEMGDLSEKRLVVEMMGRYSNLIFLDREGKILDSIRRVTPEVSSVRTVLPGGMYEAPPTQGRRNPLTETEEGFLSALEGAKGVVAKAVPGLYTGFSRITGEELSARAGITGDTPMEAISPDGKACLAKEFISLMEHVRAGEYQPCLVLTDGEPKEFSAFPLTIYGESALPRESVSEVVEAFYDLRSRVAAVRQKSQDLRQVVKTAIERTARKLDLQTEQYRDTDDREKYKIYGELLNTYGYSLPQGADHLTCTNYYDGQEIVIPLDPTLSAGENSKRYFEKYNKKKRTRAAVEELLLLTKAQLEYLQSVSLALEMAESESDLAELRRELTESGFLKGSYGRSGKNTGRNSGKNQGKKKEHKAPPSKPLHFVTEDGYHIYVGKNNIQNEYLSFDFASANDWWFHAKQRPGSHVIVKCGGSVGTDEKGNLPDHIYEIAAGLAAFYSSGKDAPKVEVDYTKKRNLRKSPGQPPGFVIYHTNFSMVVSPDRSRVTEVEN